MCVESRWGLSTRGRSVGRPILKLGAGLLKNTFKKFSQEQHTWITDYYDKYPLTFIDEGCGAFQTPWKKTIRTTQLWRILNLMGWPGSRVWVGGGVASSSAAAVPGMGGARVKDTRGLGVAEFSV